MKNLPLIFAIGIGAFLLTQRKSSSSKRQELIDFFTNEPDTIAIFQKMTEQEIGFVHDFIFNYRLKNIPVNPGSRLYVQIQIISNKYNIFT